MDKLTQLRTEYGDLQQKITDLRDLVKKENRSLTEQERTDFKTWTERQDALKPEMDQMIALEQRAMDLLANMPGPITGKKESEEERSLDKYSLNEVLKARLNNTPLSSRSLEGEWADEVAKRSKDNGTPSTPFAVPVEYLLRKQKRAYTATGTTSESLDQGGQLIETDKPGLIDALGNYMVISQMGIRRLQNLKGNLSLPVELTKPSASFATETGAAADQAGLFDTVDLSPKRLAGYIDYTLLMMTQPNLAIEPYVTDRLRYSVADAVQKNFLIGTGTSNAPIGVLTAILATGLQSLGGQVLESGGTMDWDSVVDLETLVDLNNALQGSMGYLMNSKLRGTLKTTAKGTSTNDHYLWSMYDPQTPINGYQAWVTNHIPSTSTGTALTGGTATTLTFGNWNDSVLASWGDIFIDLDNQYINQGTKRLVINTFWDVAVLRTKSFSILNDITTSFYGGS